VSDPPAIRDCADALGSMARMCVEYHSFVRRQQKLGETILLLELTGFGIHARIDTHSTQPFHELVIFNEKDERRRGDILRRVPD
jgi:hypothetical protein